MSLRRKESPRAPYARTGLFVFALLCGATALEVVFYHQPDKAVSIGSLSLLSLALFFAAMRKASLNSAAESAAGPDEEIV